MTLEIPGKIYLADQRGLLTTKHLRRHSTFSFGAYAHPDKQAFGRLYGLNEETLAGAHTLELAVGHTSQVLVLPITGALEVGLSAEPTTTLEVEEIQLLTLPAGTVLRFTNPYETDLISFLHIWLLAPEPAAPAAQQVFYCALQAPDNQLRAVVPAEASQGTSFALSLGRFAGRGEAVYQVRRPGAQLFAFVLAGAFELAGRLLHANDGLALWNTTTAELEALSNNALVLILELT